MISRIWHGWTTHGNADAYESLLKNEIFPGIQARRIPGYRGIQLYRRDLEAESEFITVMWFDSLDAVKAFAGADHDVAVVPSRARELLSRYDQRSAHYVVRESLVA
jgi:heme-degrading monooxygenase HmoA